MAASPGYRVNTGSLDIAFDYDPLVFTPAVGDRVEIAANRKVVPVSTVGSLKQVGTVLSVRDSLTECVVRVKGQANRQDRIAGETVTVGQFVYGPGGKVWQYTPAVPARHDGTTTGPKTVVLDTSDKIKLKIEGGTSQTITLTAGANLTFAAIAQEINTTLTDMTVVVDSGGHLDILANDIFKSVEVETVANNAYTLLGWTAAVYKPTAPSHDPSAVNGLILVGGDADAAVEVIEY